MKKMANKNSAHLFLMLQKEIDEIKKALENKDFYAIDLYIMEEREVLEFLGISKKTLYNYRKKQAIKTINFFGRNVYLRHEIYETIIKQILL